MSSNIVWSHSEVTSEQRTRAYGHRGATLWFTGLSGSGKSTVARRVESLLVARGAHAYVLDGDNIRHGLCRDLGFSPKDRTENIRRIGEVAKLFTDAGTLTLAAFVSPYRADRDAVRALLRVGDFFEIHVAADIAVCEARDVKGLYAKARAGEIKNFTGIDAPYEEPLRPELLLRTDLQDVDASAAAVLRMLADRGVMRV